MEMKKNSLATAAKKKLLIVGAGGHGRVAADVAAAMQAFHEIAFLDDDVLKIEPAYPIIGKVEDAPHFIGEWSFFVAVGNNLIRKKITEELTGENASIDSLVHPSAILGTNVCIGEGSIIMPGVIVNNHAEIGKSVILNTSCSVDHDCVIGDYCHVAVGAHLCGTVKTGKNVWIAAGSTVINNVSICDDCTIGAGAVVIKDIHCPGTYIGVPAKQRVLP